MASMELHEIDKIHLASVFCHHFQSVCHSGKYFTFTSQCGLKECCFDFLKTRHESVKVLFLSVVLCSGKKKQQRYLHSLISLDVFDI